MSVWRRPFYGFGLLFLLPWTLLSLHEPSDEQWHNQMNAKGYFCVSPFFFYMALVSSQSFIFTEKPTHALMASWTKDVPTNATQWVEIVMVIFPSSFSPHSRHLLQPFIHYSLDVFLPFSQPHLIFPNCLLPLCCRRLARFS